MFAPRSIWCLAMFAPCVVALGCSTRVAGPESRCDREARTKTQTLAMTKEMCVGAPIPDASAAPAATESPAEPPAPSAEPAPETPPDGSATPSASPEAGPPEPPPPPPPPPPAPPPPPPPADSKLLDPAQCDVDCTKACGGVPDAICKRVGDKEVECTLAGPSFPGC